MKYDVIINRTYIATATISVDAKDSESAKRKALKKATDDDMNIEHWFDEVATVVEKAETA